MQVQETLGSLVGLDKKLTVTLKIKNFVSYFAQYPWNSQVFAFLMLSFLSPPSRHSYCIAIVLVSRNLTTTSKGLLYYIKAMF